MNFTMQTGDIQLVQQGSDYRITGPNTTSRMNMEEIFCLAITFDALFKVIGLEIGHPALRLISHPDGRREIILIRNSAE